jgi:hypothetical protein
MELLTVKLMTRDNVRSMEVDSVCVTSFPSFLSFQPQALEAVVPVYLNDDTPRAKPSIASALGLEDNMQVFCVGGAVRDKSLVLR